MKRLVAAATALALVALACGGPQSPLGPPDDVPSPALGGTPRGSLPGGPSALADLHDPGLPRPLVETDLLISAQAPDGIPSIDDPAFVTVAQADGWIQDQEGVIYVAVADEVHAYPVQILVFHEIVNDVVAGVPVTVTYCPLCNTAIGYRREINGVVTTFGTSGRLFASALVMYDRATESLWTHFDGRAVAGLLVGHELDAVPAPLVGWSDFKAAFPDGVVLDKFRTGERFRYGDNPYPGYDVPDSYPFLYVGDQVDARSPAMQRVVGVVVDGVARAWSLDVVSGETATATHATVGDTRVVLFWVPGQRSALQTFHTHTGRDVGSVGVFSPIVDGDTLEFEVVDGRIVDRSGSEWDVTGRAVGGPMVGTGLQPLPHLDTFWFAWSAYWPETDLVQQNEADHP